MAGNMADPKARLTGIFQAASGASGEGNDALRYVAPREPSRQQQQQAQQQQSQQQTSAAAIVYSTNVSLYQYDATARKYVQLGATVGCVLVGSGTSYNVLFYNAAKQHLCVVPAKFGGFFRPTLQAKHYLNFYDDKGVNWSVKFASDDQVAEFMRQLFLAKIHVEIWGDDKTVTKTSPNALIKDDLVFVKEDATTVAAGDTVAVSFSCWRVVGNASSAPNDVVSKYPPFEKASDAELRKIRLGDGHERIKALEEGIVGMRKGGRRMILAPPGKTNGQDWYLIDVQLVKTKSGSAASQHKSVPAVNTSSASSSGQEGSAQQPAKTPRRRSSPSGSSSSSKQPSTVADPAGNGSYPDSNSKSGGDIVPYDEDSAARDELELKELRMLQREKQLEIQAKALERARLSAAAGLNTAAYDSLQSGLGQQAGYSSFGFGAGIGGGIGGSLFNSPSITNPLVSTTGRPLDALVMELHAKVDYLIRMAPSANNNTSTLNGVPIGGVTDVSAVIRGVERLAAENERLLLQINSQNQQYTSYERRCEELLKQNQRLQEEKRQLDDKYQSVASAQLNITSEIASLTSARDAAITQTNRLHAEYQKLLQAFYQKEQVSSTSSRLSLFRAACVSCSSACLIVVVLCYLDESEEQRNALNFERESRMRLEKELKKETQTRALVEQELHLAKKQYDVYMKLKDSELQNQKGAVDKQVLAIKTQVQHAADERVRQVTAEYEQQASRQQEELRTQLDRQEKEAQQQVDKLNQVMAQLQKEKNDLAAQVEQSTQIVVELEAQLESANAATEATANAAANGNGDDLNLSATGLAEEEKRIYVEQIEMLQEQVKELEQEKFTLVQKDMDAMASGRPSGEAIDEDALAAREREVEAKHEAAERTLAMAEAIKREAQELMVKGGGGDDDDHSARLVTLFKESVNDMFFRFQDFFEEEQAMDGKKVLSVIRKVLKQSTKEVIQRLEEPVAVPAVVVTEESTTTHQVAEEEDADNESDGPPAPPPNPNADVAAAAAAADASPSPDIMDEAKLAAAVEAAPTPAPTLVKERSAPELKPPPQYPSSDDGEGDESDDDFN